MKSIDEIGGRNPEFRERRPELPPLPSVDVSGPDVPERRSNGWVWVFPAGAVGGLVVVALVVMTAADGAGANGVFLQTLWQAAQRYRADYGVLPPGDGLGSSELRRALTVPGPRGVPYLVVTAGQVDAAGHLLDPGGRRVLYRPRADGAPDLRVDPP
jgi:hypothetical protein